jgi:hypothetical protein
MPYIGIHTHVPKISSFQKRKKIMIHHHHDLSIGTTRRGISVCNIRVCIRHDGLGLLSMVSRGSESAWNKETFNKYGTPVEDLGSFALDVLVSKRQQPIDDKVGSHVFPVQREGCLVRGTHLIIDLPCVSQRSQP